MAFIAIPNTAEVEFRMLWNGEPVENTLYFKHDGTLTIAELTNLVDGLDTYWVAEHLTRMASSVIYVETFGRILTSSIDPGYSTSVSAGTAGGNSNPSMPNNVSWTVKFITGYSGRSYRGRNYVVGLTEADCAGNSIGSTPANAIVADYELLLTTAKPADFDWVVASRYSNNAPRSPGITTPIVGAGYADLVIDSRKNRLPLH